MRVPQAYRSLARPSSALKPSDPPAGTVATFIGSALRRSRNGRCTRSATDSDPGTGPVDAWTTRTHGRICTPVDGRHALTLPIHACAGWCIGSVGFDRRVVSHLRDAIRDLLRVMDPLGFEPRASSLQRRHSPTELWAHPRSQTRAGSDALASVVQRCPIGRRRSIERGVRGAKRRD